jgi:hypothetical protein
MKHVILKVLGWFAGLVDRIANKFIWWSIRQTDTMGLMGS